MTARGLLLSVLPTQSKEVAKARGVLLEVVAFTVTLILASVGRWEARDLIWGLWCSSLCVGYAYIVTAIVAGVVRAEARSRVLFALGGVGLLAFFTFHFGMFHFVHGTFLNLFFPLVEEGASPGSIFAYLGAALRIGWPLVVMSLIARLPRFPFAGVDLKGKDAFAAPYANVVRMHLLIFVFAGLHFAGLSRYSIYPVLAAYFFPWRALREAVGDSRRAASHSS